MVSSIEKPTQQMSPFFLQQNVREFTCKQNTGERVILNLFFFFKSSRNAEHQTEIEAHSWQYYNDFSKEIEAVN